ncbi:hypothetical protein EIN_181090, partial [Entamoeba invadens IP1]|uniref:hypothetical protein n=1 Tax=Entamoeba invadens IP1 TaxID=370355 RepID=UPI0002C3DB92
SERYFYKYREPTVIVVDANSLLFQVMTTFNHSVESVDTYFTNLKFLCDRFHVELIFVSDGLTPCDKIAECIHRVEEGAKIVKDFFASPHSIREVKNHLFQLEKRAFYLSLSKHFESIRANGEADQLIVKMSIQKYAYAIVTNDSDFLLANVGGVINCRSFVRATTLALKNRSPQAVFFDVFNTNVIRKYIDLPSDFLPVFSCLCGNDFTKTFCTDTRIALGIVKRSDFGFDETINFIKEYPGSPNDLVQTIINSLTEEDSELMIKGLESAEEMQKIVDVREVTIPGINISDTCHSWSNVLSAWSIATKVPSYCDPQYENPLKTTSKVRKLLYDVYKPNSQIVEHYDDHITPIPIGFVVVSNREFGGDIFWWLRKLDFDNNVINFFARGLKGEFDMWKAVFCVCIVYHRQHVQCNFFEFLCFEWYYLASWYQNKKQIEYLSEDRDHRIPLHVFSSFHVICYDLMEVIIDACNISPNFYIQFASPNVYQFVSDFEQQETLKNTFQSLACGDYVFTEILQMFFMVCVNKLFSRLCKFF